VTLRHVTIGAVQVSPITAIQCASVNSAVRVIPTHDCGPPSCALRVMKDCAVPVQYVPPAHPVIVHLERVIEPIAKIVDDSSAQQRRHNLHRLQPDRLHVGVQRALCPQCVEVRQSQVVRAVFKQLVVGEFVKQQPHHACVLTRLLWSCGPCSLDLLRSRPPCHHPQQLGNTAHCKDCKKHADSIAYTNDTLIPKRKQQQQQQRCPYDAQDQNDAIGQRQRTHSARTFQQIRGHEQHHHQPHPWVVR